MKTLLSLLLVIFSTLIFIQPATAQQQDQQKKIICPTPFSLYVNQAYSTDWKGSKWIPYNPSDKFNTDRDWTFYIDYIMRSFDGPDRVINEGNIWLLEAEFVGEEQMPDLKYKCTYMNNHGTKAYAISPTVDIKDIIPLDWQE